MAAEAARRPSEEVDEEAEGYKSITPTQLSAVLALAPRLRSLDLRDGSVAWIDKEAIGELARARLACLTMRGKDGGMLDGGLLDGACALLVGLQETLETVTIEGVPDGARVPKLPHVIQLRCDRMSRDVAARIAIQCPRLLRLACSSGLPWMTDAACQRLKGLDIAAAFSAGQMRRFTTLRFVRLPYGAHLSLIDALPDSLVELECPGGFQRRLIARIAAQPPQLAQLARIGIALAWFEDSEAPPTDPTSVTGELYAEFIEERGIYDRELAPLCASRGIAVSNRS